MTDAERPASEGRHDRAPLVIAACLAIGAIVIVWQVLAMPPTPAYVKIGAKPFAYAIAGGLLVLAVWTVLAALRGDFPEREEQKVAPVVWIVGGLAAQMLLLKFAGFSIATGLLFAATARGFGRGPLWLTVPVGIVLAFAVWIIFAKGLQLSLPAGFLERLI